MPSSKRHMITAALPYANGPLHLGHLAGVYISADVYARFLRSNNESKQLLKNLFIWSVIVVSIMIITYLISK